MKELFSYKGVNITIGADGLFTAMVRGALVHKQSLQAMKALIDKPSDFAPFTALINRHGEFRSVKVVGLTRPSRARYRYGEQFFVVEGEGVPKSEEAMVLADTEENRRLLVDIIATNCAMAEAHDRYNKELRELRGKLATVKAIDYNNGGTK